MENMISFHVRSKHGWSLWIIKQHRACAGNVASAQREISENNSKLHKDGTGGLKLLNTEQSCIVEIPIVKHLHTINKSYSE